MAHALLPARRGVAVAPHGQIVRKGDQIERDNVPDKLFADDTLGYPGSVDGEPPGGDQPSHAEQPDRQGAARGGEEALEHTPGPEDVYEPGGGNPSPGADIEDEAAPLAPRPSSPLVK